MSADDYRRSMTATTQASAQSDLVIAGLDRLVATSGSAGVSTIIKPFDGTVLGELPKSSVADVEAAFTRARAAQQHWVRTPMRTRTRVLTQFTDLVLKHDSELLDLIQLETGKSRHSAFEEIADIVLWTSHLAQRGPAVLAERRHRGALPLLTQTREVRVPKGVVGVITPWNYPLTLPVTDSLPALLAGNGVVCKPDSQTPFCALRVLDLLLQAGLPRDLLQVVVGSGREIGSAVINRADYIMFTGSTATGRTIATQCAQRLIGFSGELGGKNPLLVLADADIERAAAGALHACFSNSGQLCIATERIYVHQAVWDEFKAAFLDRVAEMQLAAGLGWDADMGSLISQSQLEAVTEHVADARAKGVTVLAGGRPRPDLGPYFFEPTVLTDVTPGMKAYREETFGPVVSLYRVASDDKAVELANDTDYGLNAAVWSRRNGERVARQLQAGTVNINEGYAATWGSFRAPMGGMKQSGLGRRHGAEGVLKYTEAQTIARQRVVPIGGFEQVANRRWATLMSAGIRVLRHFM